MEDKGKETNPATQVDNVIDAATRDALARRLGPGWKVEDGVRLARRVEYRGYDNIVRFVNAIAEMAQAQEHHPDIVFGWGYCEIRFTTHSANGLTRKDFACADLVDELVDSILGKRG